MRIDRLASFLTSLRLTVVCLAFAVVLVFVGTLAQVDMGIYAAQAKYFRSFIVYWSPPGTGLHLPVLPGGYLVGGVLLLNLIWSSARRSGFNRENVGLWSVHLGLILLLLGQLATDLLSTESSMRLREGETKSYSEDQRNTELAVMDVTHPAFNDVVAIPESVLARQKEVDLPNLPFALKVRQFWPNSTRVPPDQAVGVSPATQGAGVQTRLRPAPLETSADRRNMPAAYVEFTAPSGSLGVWAASLWLDGVQSFTVGQRTFEVVLRPARYYRSLSLQLVKFSHDKYTGTDIPRNFSSEIRILNAATGENRPVKIYMNNPLRYGGETFYQSGYDERDPHVTILQVVRNPGWLTPYVSCVLVAAGLIWQFMVHLLGFVRTRMT